MNALKPEDLRSKLLNLCQSNEVLDRSEEVGQIVTKIETAKANDLEPYRYLRYLFERLPTAEVEADYRALLPQYVDRDLITNMKF